MIALVGFMGSGKSTLAKALGKHLGIPVYDVDNMVARLAGLPKMVEVFKTGGESYARRLEAEALDSITGSVGIIDCGGGLVTYQPSLEKLQSLSQHIILLRAPFELVKQRVGNDADRPLFAKEEDALELFNARISQYEFAATDIIDIHGQPVEDLVNEVLEVTG